LREKNLTINSFRVAQTTFRRKARAAHDKRGGESKDKKGRSKRSEERAKHAVKLTHPQKHGVLVPNIGQTEKTEDVTGGLKRKQKKRKKLELRDKNSGEGKIAKFSGK